MVVASMWASRPQPPTIQGRERGVTTSILLVAGALLTATFAPRVLTRLESTNSDPLCLLWLWWSMVLGNLTSAGLAVAVLLIPGHAGPAPVMWLVEQCRMILRLTSAHQDTGVGVGLLGALTLLTFRFGQRVRRGTVASRDRSTMTMQTLDLLGHREHDVLWVKHAGAVAFSVGGRANAIVATTGLRTRLTVAEVDAVLEHERAHLAGRHHLHVVLADAVGAVARFVPLYRQLPVAVRRLVELVADEEAARVSGRSVLRDALLKVAAASAMAAPPRALYASETAVEARLRRLSSNPRQRSWVLRTAGRVTVAVGGVASSTVAAGVTTVALLLACVWGV